MQIPWLLAPSSCDAAAQLTDGERGHLHTIRRRGTERGEVPQGTASSPTWQLPVLEGVVYLRTLGPGITLATGHHVAGKREIWGVRTGWELSRL